MRRQTIGMLAIVVLFVISLVSIMLNKEVLIIDRESLIPEDAVKVTPEGVFFLLYFIHMSMKNQYLCLGRLTQLVEKTLLS